MSDGRTDAERDMLAAILAAIDGRSEDIEIIKQHGDLEAVFDCLLGFSEGALRHLEEVHEVDMRAALVATQRQWRSS